MRAVRVTLVFFLLFFVLSLPVFSQRTKLAASAENPTMFDCAKEQSLHSPSVQANTTSFTLINKARQAIKIFWIKREGQRQPYDNEQPIGVDASFSPSTYEGGLWVVISSAPNCLTFHAV